MCSSPKGKNTSTSRNRYHPTGSTQLSTEQYGSFAQVANSALQRREARQALKQLRENAATGRNGTKQQTSPPSSSLYSIIKEKLQVLLRWLDLSAK
ncbi:hypothetical protein [Neptunomonas qingdaonensis]|uniref:Uncharacterized protein n=1 Tax=Neptunomonas qingdaonensis TaxID=1045558 RepID=A0A1I2UCS4_9GAMM|nr:hypothetical protein [Neptunomonas qingdaonensis]SFG72491.1 hypothetical protein SAMN05216175_11222 [Neptunomonas qingdaonensis]